MTGSCCKLSKSAIGLLAIVTLASVSAQTVFNVKDYGATGNGASLDTAAIQSAVNAANTAGGGTVTFPPGTYLLGGGIRLTNNLTVVLTNGVVLQASTNQSNWASAAPDNIFYATNCRNLAILGTNGDVLMDGGGLFFYQGDPGSLISGHTLVHMLEFHDCTNVTLSALHLQNSCEQTITFNDCTNLTVTSLTITNRPREFGSGDDGIDFSDCVNVYAGNLNIETGDDGICVKTETNKLGAHDIWIENCTVATTTMATKFGTATFSPAYNVVFTNITVNLHSGIVIGPNNPLPDGRCESAINVCMCNGGFNHDIVFTHYTINECSIPIYLEVNDRSGNGFGVSSNIFLGDVNCLNASNACQINVQSGATNNFKSLTISNLTMHNFETHSGTNSPPYQDNGYPYGVQIGGTNVSMPAYGLFARCVSGLQFAGTNQFYDNGGSGRPSAIVLENVTTNLPAAPTNSGIFILKANNNYSLEQPASWSNGLPGLTNVAVWDATVATTGNCTDVLSANINWGGLQILNPAAPVKIFPANGSTLALGGSGIDLNEAATSQDLWVALSLTTVQPQTWAVRTGRTLTVGDTNCNVNISSNVTVSGHVKFPNNLNLIDGGTLAISEGTLIEPTLTFTSSVVQAGSDSGGGTIAQTGGTLVLNRTDGTSGNPKSSLVLGSASGANATYNLAGGCLVDTTPNSASLVTVGGGSGSTGIFNVSGTGLVQIVGMRLANAANATATVNLSNNCAVFLNSAVGNNNLDVGRITSAVYASATLNVYGGALTCQQNVNVPHGNGPGFFNLYGGNVFIGGNLNLQDSGSGDGVVVINGGSLIVSNSINLPAGGSGTGTFYLNGGSVTTTSVSRTGTNAGLLFLNGGTLRARTATASFIGTNVMVTLGTNGAWFDTAGFNVTIPAALSAGGTGGGLTKLGAGTLTLTAASTYTGNTAISNGTLMVNNPVGSGTGSGNVIVAAGATLGGTGTVAGNVVVQSGGTLLPGLAVNGTVTYITVPQPPPFFTSVRASLTNLILAGAGGTTNGVYFVLSSTNLALPLANWTMLGGSNFFDPSGNFNFTNVSNPVWPAQFFALSLSPPTLSTADSMVLQALQNMRDEGFNTYLPSPGGLYINWIYTNQPPVATNSVNLNTDGTPDATPTLRHDRLTDIVYLAALCLYKQLHPLDPQFDSEVNRYTNICLSASDDNFAGDPDERGWIYWVLEDIIPSLPGMNGVDDAQADKYYNQYTKNLGQYPGVTPLFLDFPTNEPGGDYTVANEIEDGCVLIVNGRKRGLTNYIAAGENLLAFQKNNAWSTNLLLWPEQMGHVFTSGAKSAITPPGGEYIYDAVIKPGELGEVTEALCWAEQADPGKGFGPWAKAVLDNLQPSVNGYTLWDATNGGYYAQLQFAGSTNIQSPSLGYKLDTSYKEVGRFTVVVRAFLAANLVGAASYSSNLGATVNAAALASYYSAGHGWPYQENPDWTLFNDPPLQIWVTSESNGHAARSILSYELGR